jgi:CHASE2 domain-containing sensor protein
LQPKDVEVLANVCKKRQFLAKLIRGISNLHPSLISIDLYPQSTSCSGNEDQELEDAIKRVSTVSPILFAKHTEILQDLIANNDPAAEILKKSGFSDRDLLIAPHLPLEGQMLGYGISRSSCDTRAIPVSWIAYPDANAFLKHLPPQSVASFAYKASTTYDSELYKFVEEFLSHHKRMVTSFIPEEYFLSVAPKDILQCLDNVDNKHPDCLPDLQAKFRGKIALIGEVSTSDMHRSVIQYEKVPGYLLQANYVEGFLDDRYSSPLTAWVELPLSVVGILVVVLLFELSEQARRAREMFRPLLGVLLSYAFIMLLFGICSVWRMYFGIEADFWAPLVPLPLIELVYSWRVQARPAP